MLRSHPLEDRALTVGRYLRIHCGKCRCRPTAQVSPSPADQTGVRILERPTIVRCKTCDCEVKVGTRGPIPQYCPEHRGDVSRAKSTTKTRIAMPVRELETLRQSHADLKMRCTAALEALKAERTISWRQKELVRDLRQDNAALKKELKDLRRRLEPTESVDEDDGSFSPELATAAADSIASAISKKVVDWGQDDLGDRR